MPPRAAEDFYRTLQRLQLVLVAAGRRAWSGMGADFDASWLRVAPPLVGVATAAQIAAATAATVYVPAVLDETGQPDKPEARVQPRAFAGKASDGRSLTGLLEVGPSRAKAAVARGVAPERALEIGGDWLETALRSAVVDAGRDATTTEILARPRMGWVRAVNPPCCSRCAVLAGKWYRWSEGFQRHPRCDCFHIPAQENVAGDLMTDPEALVRRGLVADLSKAQQERLANGADLTKVLNESRDAWRVRMAADRRDARYARYTPTERRAAERRAAARAARGEDIQTVHDFMAHLTNRVDALKAARDAGYVR